MSVISFALHNSNGYINFVLVREHDIKLVDVHTDHAVLKFYDDRTPIRVTLSSLEKAFPLDRGVF